MRVMRLGGLVGVLLVVTAAMAAPNAGDLRPWQPANSWPGQPDSDARLDKPVQFWQAAMTLEAVFQGIAQQTGVKVRFFPEDDENRSVRLHLFLNKEHPPTLRDLLVQVSWVVDCTFSVTEEGGEKVYYLMGTSIGKGAAGAIKARDQQRQRDAAQWQQAMQAKVAEFEDLLKLPREEAISRFRGVDDRMLLNLLDPARRGALLLVARYLPRTLEEFQLAPDAPGFGSGPPALQAMSDEELAAVHAAFGPGTVDPNEIYITLTTFNRPGVITQLSPTTLKDGKPVPAGGFAKNEYTLMDMRPGAMLTPEESLLLQKLLGQPFTPSQEQAFLVRRRTEMEAVKQEQQVKESGAELTPAGAQLLAGAVLPFEPRKLYPSWQIAEEVARATGSSVVCDGLTYSAARAPKSDSKQVTALAMLQALSSETGATDEEMLDKVLQDLYGITRGPLRSPRWEWGDAGAFLRLRTTNRDIWRAARLPQATRDWLDAQIRPRLPESADAKSIDLSLPVDMAEWTQQIAGLTDLQAKYGGRVLDGDPHTLLALARHTAWQEIANSAGPRLVVLRLLGSLQANQWKAAQQARGLRWPEAITPDQYKLLETVMMDHDTSGQPPDDVTAFVVRVNDVEELEDGRAGEATIMRRSATGRSGSTQSNGTYATSPRAGRKWNQVRLKGVGIGTEGKEKGKTITLFERTDAFLPKVLELHAEVPQ